MNTIKNMSKKQKIVAGVVAFFFLGAIASAFEEPAEETTEVAVETTEAPIEIEETTTEEQPWCGVDSVADRECYIWSWNEYTIVEPADGSMSFDLNDEGIPTPSPIDFMDRFEECPYESSLTLWAEGDPALSDEYNYRVEVYGQYANHLLQQC